MNNDKSYTLKARWMVRSAIGALALVLATGCQSLSSKDSTITDCAAPLSQRLELAINEARERMDGGCQSQHEVLFGQLLSIGEGDPKIENKRLFSDYLLWASEKGIISPLQARETYTRYFGVKFISALSDFNTCAAVCPIEEKVMSDMRRELSDKSRGLLKIAQDNTTYGRANTLHNELEVVISATCQACTNQ